MSLTFLAPIAFIGLLSVAIPIYLHLRHRPRAIPLRFAAIEFLLAAKKKRKRRLRVEQWFLMAARALILLFLVIVFAQPFRDRLFGSQNALNDVPYMIILDDSASMLAGPPNHRFFDQAVANIRDILNKRQPDAATHLILASHPDQFAQAMTAGAIKGALATPKVTCLRAPLDTGFKRALDLFRSQKWEQATLQIFTDGSLSAWDQLPGETPEGLDIIYTALNQKPDQFRNVGLASVSQGVSASAQELDVHIQNRSSFSEDVDIEVDMGRGRSISHQLSLDANSSTTHRFTLDAPDITGVRIQLPPDDFDLDNQIVYAPGSTQKTRVMIIDGDINPLKQASESYFLAHALDLYDNAHSSMPVDVKSTAGLANIHPEDLDVLCLLNVKTPPIDVMQALLKAGKSVFIALGSLTDHEAWNLYFDRYGIDIWEPKTLSEPQPITLKDAEHDLFSGIPALEVNAYFDDVSLTTYRLASMERAQFDVPLTLADGSPVFLIGEAEAGRLGLWTSSMDLDWNDFPLQFGFVPFAHKLIHYLGQRDQQTASLVMTTDEAVEAGILDQLSRKRLPDPLSSLNVQAPLPGVYTLHRDRQIQYVNLILDPREMDFTPLITNDSANNNQGNVAAVGFKSHIREDLGPPFIWFIFILVLVETFVSSRMSLNWGAR